MWLPHSAVSLGSGEESCGQQGRSRAQLACLGTPQLKGKLRGDNSYREAEVVRQ